MTCNTVARTGCTVYEANVPTGDRVDACSPSFRTGSHHPSPNHHTTRWLLQPNVSKHAPNVAHNLHNSRQIFSASTPSMVLFLHPHASSIRASARASTSCWSTTARTNGRAAAASPWNVDSSRHAALKAPARR